VSHLGGVDETLTLAVERLERLHEVGERARLGRVVGLLVDRQDLLELVLLLTCSHATTDPNSPSLSFRPSPSLPFLPSS